MVRPILIASALLVTVGIFQACSSDDTGGGTGGSGGGAEGGAGPGPGPGPSSTGSSSGGNCDDFCAKAKTAGCEATNCVADCEAGGGVPMQCSAEGDALVACAAGAGTVTCKDGKANVAGCDAETAALLMCLQGGAGGAGQGGGGPGNCYDGQGACNPLDLTSCAAGEACDIGDSGFMCYPPPNDAAIGAACDNMAGPFCVPGGVCVMNTCAKYCCADTDCGGMTCTSVGMSGAIDVKVCQ